MGRLLAALLALARMFAVSAILWVSAPHRPSLAGFICDPRGRGGTAMSAGADRPSREYRLDDELWRFQRDRSHHVTWWAPGSLAVSVLVLLVGLLLWETTVLRDGLLVVFFLTFLASTVALVARFDDPVRLVLTSRNVELYRANGKKIVLPLRPKAKIGLYDSTALKSGTPFTLRFGSGAPPRGEYLLLYGHSVRNEGYELTKEAFDAIREEMVIRGATVIRDGPISAESTAVLTEYRLPD